MNGGGGNTTTSDQPIDLPLELHNGIMASKNKFDSDLFEGKGTHTTLTTAGRMDSDGQSIDCFVQVSGWTLKHLHHFWFWIAWSFDDQTIE